MNERQHTKEKHVWSGRDWLLLGINALIFVVMFVVFNDDLPAEVGTHFNGQGEQDGAMSKSFFWLFNGIVTVALPAVLSFLRAIDPRRQNYKFFNDYYYLTRWAVSLFLQVILLVVIFVNLDYNVPTLHLVLGGLGLLWIVIGNRMGQLRSNFFFGIKTPWALTDEHNWKLTHRLSARLWFIAGIVMFASAWIIPSDWILPVLIICVLISALVPFVYSYMLYTRRGKA
ncbi:SdpI family protein [Cohnella rhizosphaerae]|uniref:SdpI family protein n=1 Tax=Cohnella rhizosphaerae TaxID=1457232 RepID=A0A9X4QU87_9BACL|nr:SdpI family protein [Cohnella rhizosphaerae]MDG0811168.1 SdpI family protein [Cohnella rhizosphaerae]